MKQFFKNYFTFANQEKRGVWLLLVIIFLLVIFYFSMDFIFPGREPTFSLKEFEKETKQLGIHNKDSLNPLSDEPSEILKSSTEINYFRFNPNNLSETDWKKLNVPEKVISNIKRYERAGGRFKKKEDLKKIYGLNDRLYKAIEPYVFFDTLDVKDVIPKLDESPVGNLIDINSADTTELKSLKGIGSKLAARIVKYREMLGGYYTKNQLTEIFGLTKETYNSIEPSITVDPMYVKLIDINEISKDDLAKHPYIKYKLANIIVAYRETNGLYNAVVDIKKIVLINDSIYNKVEPYFIVKN